MRFEAYLGIDQTGASTGGRVRPLSGVLVYFRLDRVRVEAVELPALDLKSLSQVSLDADHDLSQFAIITDCVFGLPARALGRKDFFRIMRSTQNFDGFGSKVASDFFRKIYEHETLFPRRHVEELIGAQSVFSRIPFQRNIQTGTFRIWKDLTSDKQRWFNLWPYDANQDDRKKPWLFEGYPTWFWTERFGCARRDPKSLKSIFDRHQIDLPTKVWSLARKDPDFADAAILALGGFLELNRPKVPMPPPTPRLFSKEGWILGVPSRTRAK